MPISFEDREDREYRNLQLYEFDEKSVTYFCTDSGNFITIKRPNWFRRLLLKILGIEVDFIWR